jgi:hypothetical protein
MIERFAPAQKLMNNHSSDYVSPFKLRVIECPVSLSFGERYEGEAGNQIKKQIFGILKQGTGK